MHSLQVHQFIPSLSPNDAVGNHTLETQRILAAHDVPGRIWAEEIHPSLQGQARPYGKYRANTRFTLRGGASANQTVLLYQASTGSQFGMGSFFLDRPEPKTLTYHNITPAEFFDTYDDKAADNLRRGRSELALLARRIRCATAASEYNARELRDLGLEDVRVFPPFIPSTVRPHAMYRTWLKSNKHGIDLMFVGRVVPNKGHRHLLRAFAALRDEIDPATRLFIVGGWGPKSYMRELFQLRERLGSKGIAFTGPLSASRLAAHYETADAFVCLSDHEGFGIPLVEAMRAGLPIIAYDAGAVGETLGRAGILLKERDPFVIAELISRLSTDDSLRSSVISAQVTRAAEIQSLPRAEILLEAIRDSLG